MPKQYVRIFRDASGAVKHVRENDNPKVGDASERDYDGNEIVADFTDAVIDYTDDQGKLKASQIRADLNADLSTKSGGPLSERTYRAPTADEANIMDASSHAKADSPIK